VHCPNGPHKFMNETVGKGVYEVIGTLGADGSVTEMTSSHGCAAACAPSRAGRAIARGARERPGEQESSVSACPLPACAGPRRERERDETLLSL
jgi:hypothetical protein